MLKRFKTIIFAGSLFLAIFSKSVIHAEALAGHTRDNKKYQLSICTIFKNEAKYLKEWIEYHRLVGVDHFYLYDNGSTDRHMDVLRPYIKTGVVSLISWPGFVDDSEENAAIWALSTQIPAYENAAKYIAVKETKWLAFVDVDEYLIPTKANKLTDVLKKYDAFPGISLTSDFYDASYNAEILPKRHLLIETVEMTNAPKVNIQKSVQKILFKPEQCTSFYWPPYTFNFKDNQSPIVVGKSEIRINHYVNRHKGYLSAGKIKDKMHVDNRMLSEEETAQLLESGYEIEDQERVVYRLVPEMLKKMGYDTGWNTLK